MSISKITPRSKQYPNLLKEAESPPKQIYHAGKLPKDQPLIAVVGSRKPTPYGREVTERISGELAAAGVGIVSGLALGVDAIAHKAALDAGGYTLAVLACGLDRIYPATNRQLAIGIIKKGGGIISEYDTGTPPLKQHFPARNRIVAGLSLGVVITEAAERSGSLITARFALDNNRQVMAVPGNITAPLSVGTNNLIKAGATPVCSATDVLVALGLATEDTDTKSRLAQSPDEEAVLKLLEEGVNDGDELLLQLGWEVSRLNQTMTLMEISGKIRNLGGGKWIRY